MKTSEEFFANLQDCSILHKDKKCIIIAPINENGLQLLTGEYRKNIPCYNFRRDFFIQSKNKGLTYRVDYSVFRIYDIKRNDRIYFSNFQSMYPSAAKFLLNIWLDYFKSNVSENEFTKEGFGKEVVNFCERILDGKRCQELEYIILSSPEASVEYATKILKKPWPEAEKVILRRPASSYDYALRVLKGPWKAAENIIIMGGAYYAQMYAINILKTRWHRAESIIKKVPWRWYEYCNHFNIKLTERKKK